MTVGNTVHKKSNSCSYYSAFTSTFFLGKSGKSDIEGLFPKKSPSKRYHFFQTIFSHFFAAALDTLPVTHPSFTCSHVSLRLLSGKWCLEGLSPPSHGKVAKRQSWRGNEVVLPSSHLSLQNQCRSRDTHPITRNAKWRTAGFIPPYRRRKTERPKIFSKGGGRGGCEGSHSKHMFCHVIPEDWHFGEGPTEREIGWLHKQPFCLLLYLLLLSFPHKLTLTKITLKQEKIIVSATMKIISGIMCTLVFSLKHKGITAFLLFLFSMLSLIKP